MIGSAQTANGGMAMRQVDKILHYIQTHGSITPQEAQDYFGCMRLGARIYDLKRRGYHIVAERVDGVNKFGDKCHWARYRMGAR